VSYWLLPSSLGGGGIWLPLTSSPWPFSISTEDVLRLPLSTSTYTDDSLLPHVYAIALYNKERAPDTAEWDMAVSPPSIPRPLFHTAWHM